MHPQIQTILDDLAAARGRFQQLAAVTPDERWAKRADAARWSVAECIAHLNLSARALQPLLESASAAARALGVPASARYRRSVLGAVLSAVMGPVRRVGRLRVGAIATPPPFVPTGDHPRAEVSAEFLKHLDAHETALRAADWLPLDRIQIESPFVKRARYDAYSAWLILVRHAHRHLAQAEHVWEAS